MEYVSNTRVRRNAYIQFSLLFLVTILLVVAAVYFDIKIPAKDNERLRDEKKALQAQDNMQQPFIAAAQMAKRLIDSMGKPGQSNSVLNDEIDKQLAILKNQEQQGNVTFAIMNKNAFNVLYEYHELNKKYVAVKETPLQVEKLSDELKECDAKRAEAERNLLIYTRGINNAGF